MPDIRPLHQRKRVWAGGFTLFVIGATIASTGTGEASSRSTPRPEVTVTATATATQTAAPAPTVTVTKAAKPHPAVTVTKTVKPAATATHRASSGSSGRGGQQLLGERLLRLGGRNVPPGRGHRPVQRRHVQLRRPSPGRLFPPRRCCRLLQLGDAARGTADRAVSAAGRAVAAGGYGCPHRWAPDHSKHAEETMAFGFRAGVPGMSVRVSTRGVHASVGPRAARAGVGSGGTRISSGVGPLHASSSLSRGRRANHPGHPVLV